MKKSVKKKKPATARKKVASKGKGLKLASKAKKVKKSAPKKAAGKAKKVSLKELFELKKKQQLQVVENHPEGTIPPHEVHDKANLQQKAVGNVRNGRTNGAGARHH